MYKYLYVDPQRNPSRDGSWSNMKGPALDGTIHKRNMDGSLSREMCPNIVTFHPKQHAFSLVVKLTPVFVVALGANFGGNQLM